MNFHGETVAELKEAFQGAVDGYVAACEKSGKTPQKPYSGQIMVRVAPEVHASVAMAAELAGTSLNKWTEEALRKAAAEAQR